MSDSDEDEDQLNQMDEKFAKALWERKMGANGKKKDEQDPDDFSSMAVLPDVGGPDQEELKLFEDPMLMAAMNPGELALKAAEHGQLSVLKSVLEAHPKAVHTTDSDQYTPLHRASYGGHLECTAHLLTLGADPNALTCEQWTPLHSACRWSKWECAALLLQNGADINGLSSGGQTALHLAASTRQVEHDLLQVMLTDRRLDAHLKNNLGETAQDLAIRECPFASAMEAVDDCLNVPA